MNKFLEENWFKIGILFIGLVLVWIFYNTLIIQPKEEREFMLQQEQTQVEQEIQKQAEITAQREFCIYKAKEVLKSNTVIDNEFCSKCDGYAYGSTLKGQCLDGCLDLVTTSADRYKQSEKLCFERYPLN